MDCVQSFLLELLSLSPLRLMGDGPRREEDPPHKIQDIESYTEVLNLFGIEFCLKCEIRKEFHSMCIHPV